MGCACCATRIDSLPLKKLNTTVMPPLRWGSMGPPDLQLMNLQGEEEQLTAEIQLLDLETDLFEKRCKDYSLSAASLKGELLVSRRILDSIKSDLAKYTQELTASEDSKQSSTEDVRQTFVTTHNDQFISDLQTIENVDKYRQQFDRKILEPKGNEERLQTEAGNLTHKWESIAKAASSLLDKVERLKDHFHAEVQRVGRSATTVGEPADAHKETKAKDEASILESSVTRLSQTCQKRLMLIQGLVKSQQFTAEMQSIIDSMEVDSQLLRKDIEDFVISVPFTIEPGQVIYSSDLPDSPVKPVTETPVKAEFLDEVEESMTVEYEEEIVLAAEHDESSEYRIDTNTFEQNCSYMSSEPALRDSVATVTLTAYEAIDLFENAITEAPNNLLPADCVKAYISAKRWEPALYDAWVDSVKMCCTDDAPYTTVILSLVQHTPESLSRDALLQFPGVIRACNRLVRNVEVAAALDTNALGELTITEENEKALHTGGMMHWGDCINLIYANFTRMVGTLVLKSLRPDSIPLPDYVTFQICHKMYSQQTDGMRVFQLLDHGKSGKLSAVEFSKGLLDLLNLWTDPEDISYTFKSIYNRWSELVSKSQFSKQVNFAEYLQRTKREMAVVSKYRLLSSVLSACQSIVRQSVTKLEQCFATETEAKTLSEEEVTDCFRIAGEVTNSPRTDHYYKLWKSAAKDHYDAENPPLTFDQAKHLFFDVLCR